jgi:hypothetical protein
MFAWIDGEKWCADGQPPLTEEHGWLVDPVTQFWYGSVYPDEEAREIRKAILWVRANVPLPLYEDEEG